jgi:hypothetical protein
MQENINILLAIVRNPYASKVFAGHDKKSFWMIGFNLTDISVCISASCFRY